MTQHSDRLGQFPGERVTINGHMYVHVAACPCPEMQAEVARLNETPDWPEGLIAEDYDGDALS